MKLKLKFLPRKPNGKTAEKVIGIKIHHLRYSIFPHFSNEVSLMGDTSREDPPLLLVAAAFPVPSLGRVYMSNRNLFRETNMGNVLLFPIVCFDKIVHEQPSMT